MHAAAMWRGALIDRFARLERLALECLLAMPRDAGVKPSAYRNWERFEYLRQAIEKPQFDSVRKRMLVLLKLIEGEHDLRNALAHASVRASKAGIVLELHVWNAKAWETRQLEYAWLQALDALARIDKLQRDFASQLGQVRKLLTESP